MHHYELELQDAYHGDKNRLSNVQRRLKLSNHEAAHALGVSVRTYRRWLKDKSIPKYALKLMAVMAGYCPWPGWKEWECRNGELFPPGFYRNGISPGEWQSTIFIHQLNSELNRKNANLKSEIIKLENELADMKRERPGAPVLHIVK